MTPKLLPVCLLFLLSLPTPMKVMAVRAKAKAPIAKPGCKDTCGGVAIPFPFGIGSNCFLDPSFEIECKESSSKPFLSKFNIEVIKITTPMDGYYWEQSLEVMIPPLKVCAAETETQKQSSIDLRGTPYSFSSDTIITMRGCPGSAFLANQNNKVIAGCATICHNDDTVIAKATKKGCYGVQCCQTSLSSDVETLDYYQIDFNLQPSSEAQNCLLATLTSYIYGYNLSSLDGSSFPPVQLSWEWPNSYLGPLKHLHANCRRGESSLYCYCNPSYDGNPYLPDGCQGPEECDRCPGICYNQVDGFGHDIPNKYYCVKTPFLNLAAILGLGNSFGFLLLAACIYGLYRFIKRRREMMRRNKFFKRNGGLLLQQQLSSDKGVVERTKIFTVSEMNKATNYFNENRILGQGGQGTVYKGMLTDASIVAIKKSKLLDESQLEQFVNEVVILSQIDHRHVVKLLGCCLETEIPLLVYEFIPNGTLFQHIHDPDEDFVISWAMRLKIAKDSAAAIGYLHSSSSIPIYHRDIKSSNILLDEKHRAKVSDFGSSKTIAIDQTHMTTLVQGTMGYLDPEYFQSYQFTEKSDVYSFGVVLLELLTSKKPIYRDARTMEQKNLVTEFLLLMQNSRLSDMLDPKIAMEVKEDELISFVELAKRCISWSGKLRPTMKEVEMILEMIIESPAQVSTWYQNQEAFPIQYAAYDEFDMSGISDAEFLSITVPAGAASSSYTDECCLLPDA